MNDYLDFIRNDDHYSYYYDGIFILFNMGMRISEFFGLTVSDIDFDEHRINDERQLIRTSSGKYLVQASKTHSDIRFITMTSEVEQAFCRGISSRRRLKREPAVGGRIGFLFLDKTGMPTLTAGHTVHS